MSIKILFVYPNDYLNNGVPTGLSVLVSVLKQDGHIVSLFDYTFIKTQHPKIIKNPAVFLPTEYTIEDLVENDPVQSIEEAFEKHLDSFQPDLICLSAMTCAFDAGIDLLTGFQSKIKCKVAVGGVHATIAPEDALKPDIVDLICVGEGEEFLLELCECIEKDTDYHHIRNLGYKIKDGIKINPLRPLINIDNLPMPDWSIFDQRHLFRPYMGNVYQGSFYVMSRGCSYRCAYCVNDPLQKQFRGCGKYYRFQNPQTTIRQLKYLKEIYNATWYKIADDSIMGFNTEYLEELADGVSPLNIQFACSVRPETTSKKKVALLKSMGCVSMTIGVESGNEHLRKSVLNRKMTNKQIENALAIIKDYDIRPATFNMIGLPHETRENVFETIQFNRKLEAKTSSVYIIYPYPGTEISKKYNINYRDINGKIIHASKASVFALSAMPPSEVDGLYKTFHLYLVLPEALWPIIRYAEKNDKKGQDIYRSLAKYSESFQLQAF